MKKIIEIDTIESLIEEVRGKQLIAIDGCDGAGKTYLSQEIFDRMSCEVLKLDNFLDRDKGAYIKNIQFGKIKNFIERQRKTVVIEGVCLFRILEELKLSADCFVYVKKVNERGEWLDADECLIDVSPEDRINKIEQLVKSSFPNFQGLSNLKKEIIKYHYQYRPYSNCDCIYIRINT
jgi:hypothetical protein